MSGIFGRIFKKTEEVDIEKLQLKAALSVERSQVDKELLSLALQQEGSASYLQDFLKVNVNERIALHAELALLRQYLALCKSTKPENLFIKEELKAMDATDVSIYPFILFPLIQNAIQKGYNTLEKHPIRIRGGIVGSTFKLEVSNRVNHYLENQEENDMVSWFKARLAILYPEKHTLIINSNSNIFKATLLIDLD